MSEGHGTIGGMSTAAHQYTNGTTGASGRALSQEGGVLATIQHLSAEARVERPAPTSPDLDQFLLSAGPSDEANAQCLLRLYPERFLHCGELRWLHYMGTHWTTAGAEAALDRAIVDTLAVRRRAASAPAACEAHGALGKFCVPNKGRLEGAKHLLTSLVHTSPAGFDHCPDLLNCTNGVVDLRTGKLHPHAPGQRFMCCTRVAYKLDTDARVWLDFLAQAVRGGEAETAWLQLAVGYSLTGHTREEVLFYLFGPPRAGKGVFVETLRAVLGDSLSKEISFSSLTASRTGDVQSFDLAPLKPCRFVAASESNPYEQFNAAQLKAMTGGNSLYVAFKYRTPFNYRPQFKLWLSSNHPVNADPDDDAVGARVRVIEFPNSHLGTEDKLLKQRLRDPAVLEGVLAWAVQGAMRWYALDSVGLSEPSSSAALKQQQREASDTVGMWIAECCTPGSRLFTPAGRLYDSYTEWCQRNGIEPKRAKGLGQALQCRGYRRARETSAGKQVRGYYGLQV